MYRVLIIILSSQVLEALDKMSQEHLTTDYSGNKTGNPSLPRLGVNDAFCRLQTIHPSYPWLPVTAQEREIIMQLQQYSKSLKLDLTAPDVKSMVNVTIFFGLVPRNKASVIILCLTLGSKEGGNQNAYRVSQHFGNSQAFGSTRLHPWL
jgi:hypothetical protein